MVVKEIEGVIELLCFIGTILEMPEIVDPLVGALELVNIIAGFGVQY